jgi:hypothetical protein
LSSLDAATAVSGIAGMTLKVGVTYSGGCQTHEYKAFWDGTYDKSLPPHANVIIVHDDKGDVCKAQIEDEVHIDVDKLVNGQPGLIIDVHSLNTQSIEAKGP